MFIAACQPSSPSMTENIKQNEAKEHNNSPIILRYNVPVVDPVLTTARNSGYLSVENNCLVIKLDKDSTTSMALALPISEDKSQWQTQWDSKNQTLIFDGQRYQLGQRLDLGGHGGFDPKRISNPSPACKDYSIWGGYIIGILE